MKHMLPDSIYLPVYTPLDKLWIHWLTATKSVTEKEKKRTPCYQVPINSEKIETRVQKNYSLSAFLEDTTAAALDAPH